MVDAEIFLHFVAAFEGERCPCYRCACGSVFSAAFPSDDPSVWAKSVRDCGCGSADGGETHSFPCSARRQSAGSVSDGAVATSPFSAWAAMRPSPGADVFAAEIDQGSLCVSSVSEATNLHSVFFAAATRPASYYFGALLADLRHFCPASVWAATHLSLVASPLTACLSSPLRNRAFQSSST